MQRLVGLTLIPLLAAGGLAAASDGAVEHGVLQLFGDFRLRLEENAGDQDVSTTQRMQLRTRAGVRYVYSPRLTLGTRVTFSETSSFQGFDRTATALISSHRTVLDHAYLRYQRENWSIGAGRFVNPFSKTDYQLVWDNDFNPQGLTAELDLGRKEAHRSVYHVIGIQALLEPEGVGAGSQMTGVQLVVSRATDHRRFRFAVGYFDYSLNGRPHAHSGRVRGNRLDPDGGYTSDYDLLNVIGSIHTQPFGPSWPIEIVGDYVKNLGADAGTDTGYAIDVFAGNADHAGDVRVNYTLSRAQVDSVLTAVSHDNTRLGSNYFQHSFGVEFIPRAGISLSATWYHYRPDNPLFARANDSDDWLERVRLNFNISL